MGRVTWLLLGWLATAAAWWLGTAWPVALVAAVLYLGAFARGMVRVAALVAAPLVLAVSPLEASWQAAAWLGVAGVALAPLWLGLGGRLPWRGIVVAAGLAVLIIGLAWASPWRITVFQSDVAVRFQVALLALAAFLATAVARASGRRMR